MMEKNRETILIILAAGEASRMGRPKQVLPVNGVPLIDYQLSRWQKLFALPPVVVTGAHSREVRASCRSRTNLWVHNPGWEAGLGSSIIKAMSFVHGEFPTAQACLIVLLDQVFIGPVHFQKLLEARMHHADHIIASAFERSSGPPVIFPRKYWPDLLLLDPRKGAAALFRKYPDQLFRVSVPEAAFDLDTPPDYEMFLRRLNGCKLD